MKTNGRRRNGVIWVIPLILAIVPLNRISEGVRTVDLVRILACGVIIGIAIANLIHSLAARSTPQA